MAANSVSEIDASGRVLASVPVGTNPIALAASHGAIWAVNASDDTVSRIDPATHAVQDQIDVGHEPRAIAVTGDDLWVTNFRDDTVSRINVEVGREVDAIDVGSGPDAIAAGPAGLWVANSKDNTIQRIDTATGIPEDPVDVDDGPDGLAVDETSVWVSNGRSGTVWRIDASTGGQMTAPIRVGSGPRGIVRVGDEVWVANELSQTITRIDVETGHPHPIDVGDGPTTVAALGGSVWVAEKFSGDLVRIDPATEKQRRFHMQGPVNGVVVAEGRLWIASGAFASSSHRGGTLVVAAVDLPGAFNHALNGIDPARAYDVWAHPPLRVVYDGLLAYHYAGVDPQVLVPDLATSVPDPTDGRRTYVFNLRPGIRYSTGDEVKASDLVRGVHRALLVKGDEGRRDFYAGIVGGQACIENPASCDLSKGVEADDAAGRVTFHLVAPDPQFLNKLTLLVVPTPPGTPLGELTSPLPGTGPYQIASYKRNKEYSLTRNPFFQQWSAPAQPAGFLDGITWAKAADVAAAVDAVQQGRADLAEFTSAGGIEAGPLIERLRVSAPSRVHDSLTSFTAFAVLNSSIPPFDSLRARQAFNYAVDRNKIIEMSGGPSEFIPTCQLMPPTMPSYVRYCPYSLGAPGDVYQGPDLVKAHKLVRASGTLGMKVTVTDLLGDFNGDGSLEAYYARVLRKLGYQATVRRLPNNPRNQEFFNDPQSGIQVESGGFAADFPAPSNFYEIVACAGTAYQAPLTTAMRTLTSGLRPQVPCCRPRPRRHFGSGARSTRSSLIEPPSCGWPTSSTGGSLRSGSATTSPACRTTAPC